MTTRIRDLRIARDMTMAALAAQVGTSKSHVWALEHGHTNPSAALLARVAAALGVTVEYLLGADDDLAGAEDRAFFRRYLAMPKPERARVRALVDVMGGME